MEDAQLISMLFRDEAGVMYENPPPPSDYSEDELESILFTFSRPQSVPGVNYLNFNRNLILESFACEKNQEEQNSIETVRGAENRACNENIEGIKAIEEKESSDEIIVTENAFEKKIGKKKKKERKQRTRSKRKKRKYSDSDDSENGRKKKFLGTKSSALQSISKSSSMSESDSDYSKKHRTKSHNARSRSKKSSRPRKKHKASRNDYSYSDLISYDKLSLRSAKCYMQREIISSDEESFSSSFSKESVIEVWEEVNKDTCRKTKIKISKSSKKKYDDSRSRNDSGSHDDSRSRGDPRNQFIDSRSPHDNKNRFNDSWSPNGSRNRDNSRRNYSDYSSDDGIRNRDISRRNYSHFSSDDDSKNRHYDDSNCTSRNLSTDMHRKMKQELGSASCYGQNDYYCEVCKLTLNSEIIFSTHMVGKRHKKVVRQLSEQKVVESTVMEITESQNFPIPPGVDRIELYDKKSKIQEICEDADLLIVGLDYVREIRGYEDTKYFCDLCSTQCIANSIMRHLVGLKHRMNCLEKYCYRSYCLIKDLDKRDKRVNKELKLELEEARRFYGKGKIRVFEDVKRKQTINDREGKKEYQKVARIVGEAQTMERK
ncbi:unnamed protein product [Larinioides sclopetarius]|uniref:Matrin-type domain-containing protein n=1 Tax=Larinioides sclopetarius TaxID=280406 RepID=A0AAV2BI27_9ARAC